MSLLKNDSNIIAIEQKQRTTLHTKRDIMMVLLAVLILATVTLAVHFTRMANAGYDDHFDPKTSSIFHYEVNGF